MWNANSNKPKHQEAPGCISEADNDLSQVSPNEEAAQKFHKVWVNHQVNSNWRVTQTTKAIVTLLQASTPVHHSTYK